MSHHQLTLSIAKKLLQLLEGKTLPASVLPNWLVIELQSEELIVVETHGSRNSYRPWDREALQRYIETQYTGGASLSRWITLLTAEKGELDRSVLVKETSDSKSIDLRTFRGFLVNCYEPIEVRLGETTFTLSPVADTAVFIQNPDHFHIPEEVLVVGVENGDNFRQIRRQRYLFPAEKVLFVSRYPQSSDLRHWLMTIPNRYLHFGDFDLAGIHIYQSEFYRFLGERAKFLIPEDIEEKLKKGKEKLYNQQYAKYHLMKIEDERIRPLVELIHRYRKGYEQEGYLE